MNPAMRQRTAIVVVRCCAFRRHHAMPFPESTNGSPWKGDRPIFETIRDTVPSR